MQSNNMQFQCQFVDTDNITLLDQMQNVLFTDKNIFGIDDIPGYRTGRESLMVQDECNI
jgi:hypothetical protein